MSVCVQQQQATVRYLRRVWTSLPVYPMCSEVASPSARCPRPQVEFVDSAPLFLPRAVDKTRPQRDKLKPEQEQQRVAVGPGNVHFISIHRVSSDAVTLRDCVWPAARCCWYCSRLFCWPIINDTVPLWKIFVFNLYVKFNGDRLWSYEVKNLSTLKIW